MRILAYSERVIQHHETGDNVLLRKEWRVRRYDELRDRKRLDEQFGEFWPSRHPFAKFFLEKRQLRDGVVHCPWEPQDVSSSVSSLYRCVDTGAVPVAAAMRRWCEERAKEAEQKRREEAEAAERAAEAAARDERQRAHDKAFARMAASPRFDVWAGRWNGFVADAAPHRGYLADLKADNERMSRYREAITAVTVPALVKAIREFIKEERPRLDAFIAKTAK